MAGETRIVVSESVMPLTAKSKARLPEVLKVNPAKATREEISLVRRAAFAASEANKAPFVVWLQAARAADKQRIAEEKAALESPRRARADGKSDERAAQEEEAMLHAQAAAADARKRRLRNSPADESADDARIASEAAAEAAKQRTLVRFGVVAKPSVHDDSGPLTERSVARLTSVLASSPAAASDADAALVRKASLAAPRANRPFVAWLKARKKGADTAAPTRRATSSTESAASSDSSTSATGEPRGPTLAALMKEAARRVVELRRLHARFLAKVENFNNLMAERYIEVEEARVNYNEEADETEKCVEQLVAVAQKKVSAMSEQWQEGDKGQDWSEFIEGLEALQLEQVDELPEPDELDPDGDEPNGDDVEDALKEFPE